VISEARQFIKKTNKTTMTMTAVTYDGMRDGCYDRDARVKDFELNWVDGSLPFPTFPRFCGQTFYEGEEFNGASFRVDTTIPNFAPLGFNDRASSAVVEQGRWQVCEDAAFRGRCAILSPGNYPSLAPIGFNYRISSVRPVEGQAQYPIAAAPPPAPPYDYRRRPDEHLFEVPVHSVRAVVGPPEQRCWVERQQVVEPRRRGWAPGRRRTWAGRGDGWRRRCGGRYWRQCRQEPRWGVQPGRPALCRGSRFGAS